VKAASRTSRASCPTRRSSTSPASRNQIVGDDEADIKSGKLSVNSPIARGLIGREEGDTVQIDTPGGTKEYEIDKVEHL